MVGYIYKYPLLTCYTGKYIFALMTRECCTLVKKKNSIIIYSPIFICNRYVFIHALGFLLNEGCYVTCIEYIGIPLTNKIRI